MEASSIIHLSDSIYSFPLDENTIEIRLLTKKDDDIKKVELIYNDKYFFHEKVFSQVIQKTYTDNLYDYYVLRFALKDTRFAYVFRITSLNDEVFYFSESGVTKTYDISKGFYDFFQVSFINSSDIIYSSKKFKDRVFYQIFVDRFFASKDYKNPRVNMKWGEKVTPKSIAGGSLKGIEEKIPYLKDLGVNALYLTPIFKSESNHKYDIIDYYEISEDFGSKEDLKSLITSLHKNDILLVLDMVFNHISADSFFFQDVIKNGKKSKYFDWFIIHGDKVDLKKKNYETFAGCLTMPKLNMNNEKTATYFINLCLYYIKEFHVDGFRLDVSDEVAHSFWIRLKEEIKKIDKDFILIGENWHNSQSFLNSGKELDSIMNYALTKEMINYFAKEKTSTLEFKNNIYSLLARYKTNVNFNLLNLLSSHDVYRFINECDFKKERYILAYAFLLFYLGIPCIYYGDEFALEGGYDPDSRRCFIWDENDPRNDKTVNHYLKELIRIHKSEEFKNSSFSLKVKDEMLIIERKSLNLILTLYINKSGHDIEINNEGETLLSYNFDDKNMKNYSFLVNKKEY